MQATLDHVVFWTENPLRAVDFYDRVVGLTPVRAEEFRAGTAPFPSVRISATTIIDLMARVAAPVVDAIRNRLGAECAGHAPRFLCVFPPSGARCQHDKTAAQVVELRTLR